MPRLKLAPSDPHTYAVFLRDLLAGRIVARRLTVVARDNGTREVVTFTEVAGMPGRLQRRVTTVQSRKLDSADFDATP